MNHITWNTETEKPRRTTMEADENKVCKDRLWRDRLWCIQSTPKSRRVFSRLMVYHRTEGVIGNVCSYERGVELLNISFDKLFPREFRDSIKGEEFKSLEWLINELYEYNRYISSNEDKQHEPSSSKNVLNLAGHICPSPNQVIFYLMLLEILQQLEMVAKDASPSRVFEITESVIDACQVEADKFLVEDLLNDKEIELFNHKYFNYVNNGIYIKQTENLKILIDKGDIGQELNHLYYGLRDRCLCQIDIKFQC